MFGAGEGLDPSKTESPENPGLGTEGEPPAAADETPPEPADGAPTGEPTEEGPADLESTHSDEAIFTALEKDVPEELKPKALELKKRVQGYITRKTQELAKHRITPEIASTLQEYSNIENLLRRDPKAGFREIARRLQALGYIKSPDELLVAEKPAVEPIDPSKIENWEGAQKYFTQELQRRDAVIENLKTELQEIKGQNETTMVAAENRSRGLEAVVAAARTYQGFAQRDKQGNVMLNNRGEPIPTAEGMRAIKLVVEGRVLGPTALEDAWALVTTPSLKKRLEELEKTNRTIKSGVRGAQPPTGGKPIKTEERILGTGNVFSRAKEDVLKNGLGV